MRMGVASSDIAARLLQVVNRGNCIAWIGSGLSIPAGYPSWEKLIGMLCTACGITREAQPNPADLLTIADACKAANCKAYEEVLASKFGKTIVRTRRAYSQITKLSFKGYVTTNYDPLLLDVLGPNSEYSRYPSLSPEYLGAPFPHAFYIHGLARNTADEACGENLVLSTSEFEQAYQGIGTAKLLLNSVLNYHDVIFFGCTLREPEFNEVFDRMQNIQAHLAASLAGYPQRERVILCPCQYKTGAPSQMERWERALDLEDDEAKRFQSMGIEALRYERSEGDDHDEVEEILDDMLKLSRPDASKQPSLRM